MNLDYVVPLSLEESRAVYLAKQADGREVVVKFPLTYNTRAHRLLADHDLAPDLIYDGTERPRCHYLVGAKSNSTVACREPGLWRSANA